MTINDQAGYTVLGAVMALAVLGLAGAAVTAHLDRVGQDRIEAARVSDITHLAQAQVALFLETGAFDAPTDPDPAIAARQCVVGVPQAGTVCDFLPQFGERAALYDVVTNAAGDALQIGTEMDDAAAALRVASQLGAIAQVDPDDDERVIAIFPGRNELVFLDAIYLRLDGTNSAVAAGDTELPAARWDGDGLEFLDITNDADAGTIRADIGRIITLQVNTFRAEGDATYEGDVIYD